MKYSISLLLTILLVTGCKTYKTEKALFMETNKNMDSPLISDTLDIAAFYKRKDSKQIYTLSDGTIIEETGGVSWMQSVDDPSIEYYVKIIPPKPKFHTILQVYDAKGKIIRRGKMLARLTVGIWEMYDSQGNKSEENEDLKYGEGFSYNDIYLFLHKKGLINIETGENREKVTIQYLESDGYWDVDWIDKEKTFTQITYHLDLKTGEVLRYGKANTGSEIMYLKGKLIKRK